MSNVNRQYRRRLQKGTPKEHTPKAGPLGDALRQAAGIPARPTPEQMQVVTSYIGWLLATPMPAVRKIVDNYIRTGKEGQKSEPELAVILTIGFAFITSMPRIIGDDVDRAVTQAFRSSP